MSWRTWSKVLGEKGVSGIPVILLLMGKAYINSFYVVVWPGRVGLVSRDGQILPNPIAVRISSVHQHHLVFLNDLSWKGPLGPLVQIPAQRRANFKAK